ncbi:MAG: DUF1848 family protein [Deltaproteobacteria bacterium]|nr:DUF1848 family protein [Deltaproteobacteria bacterium]
MSRRTDIPALFGPWFARRLEEGFAEYVPLGPPRRVRCSLRPEEVTHFAFWSKWPRPFFPVLERVIARGYPVLWNVTVTGLGGTAVEPHVPAPERALEAVTELARRVPASAILWRYDPVFVSSRYPAAHHLETFARLAERLAGQVDRVAISFLTSYARQVAPDLRAYAHETRDQVPEVPLAAQVDLAGRLADLAREAGLSLTVCCSPELRAALGAPRAECNSFAWAARVYPALAARRLPDKPCRPDCGCSKEVDLGVYDTCVLGCRYSYGSACEARARVRFAAHDPEAPCLIP